MKNYKLEICVDSVASAIAAEKGGADRIELCSALSEGGLTPSAGLISNVKNLLNIDVHVLIRPRRGDFYYSDLEIAIMKHDIVQAKQMGVKGIVLGVLQKDGHINTECMQELIALARPLNITFHRAFDLTPDPAKALDELLQLKVDRLLTSGQRQGAEQGLELITQLVKRAGDVLTIMPGGGINEGNVQKIKSLSGAREFHTSAKTKQKSLMEFKKESVLMADNAPISEFELMETSEEKVREIKRILMQ
jgi:copper homeostasis protein